MTGILAARANEARRAREALIGIRRPPLPKLERMWVDAGPIDPWPTVDQTLEGAYRWLEIRWSPSRTPPSVALTSPARVARNEVRSRPCQTKCREAGKRLPRELRF